MKRLIVMLSMLGLAAPALADEMTQTAHASALTDGELDQVTAGHGNKHQRHEGKHGNHHGAGVQGAASRFAPPDVNINVSPIIVNQTAVALNTQTATGNKGGVKQDATALAANTAVIDYRVKF
jgi:hypothetical protein